MSHVSVPASLSIPAFEAVHRGATFRSVRMGLKQLYYDTVLLNQESLELLFKIVGADRCLFGTDRPSGSSAWTRRRANRWTTSSPTSRAFPG